MKISHSMGTCDSKSLIGYFKGSSTSSHRVEGFAKVLDLEDGKTLLRLKNLKAANDQLYMYIFPQIEMLLNLSIMWSYPFSPHWQCPTLSST